MADEKLVEGSILAQVRAIEAWALKAKEEAGKSSPNSDEILSALKKINLQGRKLQWRGAGLKSLSEGKLKEDLNKKLSEARVAAMKVHGDIRVGQKIAKAENIALKIDRRDLILLKELVKEAIEARKIIELFAKDLSSLRSLVLGGSAAEIEDFLRGEGNYAAYDLNTRRRLWNDWKTELLLTNKNLSNINLSNFYFYGSFTKCDFSHSNLNGCQFIKTVYNTGYKLNNCSFDSADLILANFGSSVIVDCKFENVVAVKANFSLCRIIGSTFSGNFKQANFAELLRREKGEWPESKCSELILNQINLEEADFKNATVIFILSPPNPASFKKADFRGSNCGWMNKFIGLDKIMLNFEDAKVNGSRFNFYGTFEGLEELFVKSRGTPEVNNFARSMHADHF
ncbi:MAG: pentapeptide repeat-containing protein [Nanoarchaeota archaeon]